MLDDSISSSESDNCGNAQLTEKTNSLALPINTIIAVVVSVGGVAIIVVLAIILYPRVHTWWSLRVNPSVNDVSMVKYFLALKISYCTNKLFYRKNCKKIV